MYVFILVALFLQTAFGAVPEYSPKNYSYLIGMEGFTDQMLQIHFKLYEGYVKNTNELLAKLQAISDSGKQGSYEFGALKRRLGWEFDGMRLHEFYFGNLGGDGMPDPKSPLYATITNQFGSFDAWKKDFIATGLIRGIGWTILYFDPNQKKLVNTWINEHDVGHLATSSPILIMDVWEHAYITEYGLDRSKYIDAFFKNIEWKIVQSRFAASSINQN